MSLREGRQADEAIPSLAGEEIASSLERAPGSRKDIKDIKSCLCECYDFVKAIFRRPPGRRSNPPPIWGGEGGGDCFAALAKTLRVSILNHG